MWLNRVFGAGIKVAIVDDGVDINHDELKENYLPALSYNFVNNSNDIYFSTDSKSTEAAGLISAVSNNWRCGVGAAPYSKFLSLQIYGHQTKEFSDVRMGNALSYQIDIIDIYLINWHIHDLLNIRKCPKSHTIIALKKGITFGRKGLGNIYVAGSGNKKNLGNNCAFNGLLQRNEILVIGAMSRSGQASNYSEGCNAVLAAALSNEEDDIEDKIYTTTSNNMCEKSANGSYAAAAVGAGILALLISYNPELTIRQIIKLIAITSIQYDPYSVTNAAGFTYSNYFGFGLLNVNTMMAASKEYFISSLWVPHVCSSDIISKNFVIKGKSEETLYIYSSGCLNFNFCVSEIENIIAVISLLSRTRRAISVFLTSPSGTLFKIIDPRPFDDSRNGFHKWKLKLMGFMGEEAVGIWKLKISCSSHMCRLMRFELIFSGSCLNPSVNIRKHSIVKNFVFINRNISKNIFDRLFKNQFFASQSFRGMDPVSFTSEDFQYFLELSAFN